MGLFAKFRNSFSRDTVHSDADDELTWHLEQRTQEYINSGMPAAEARASAQKRLGNLTLLKEHTAESDVLVWFELAKRDITIALRMLRRAPTVTAIAVLSLALGIGANTVVFTLMKQVVLDYLPVPAPEQLVILHSQEPDEGHTHSDGMRSSFSYPLYKDLNLATSSIFAGVLALRPIDVSLSGGDVTETVKGDLVSGNFFQVLQVTPWRGRLFTSADDQQPNSNPVAVLGYGLWIRRFGGDSTIVNRTIILNKHPYLVVGIAPPKFYGIDVSSRSDLFVPMSMKADVVADKHLLSERLDHWCSLIGRLKPGITIQQASAALRVIYPPLRDQDFASIKTPTAEFKQRFTKKIVELTPGGKGYAGLRDELSHPLTILMAMVGTVLFITIVNVANLLVARGVARQREMAIRLSVGAGKAVLVRQLMTESIVLAMMGGCMGILIAYTCTPLLLNLLSFDFDSASISAHPDWRVLLFTSIVTFSVGLAFGLLPAWQSARTDVASSLKADGSLGIQGHSVWLRRSLVVTQVALSLVLVVAAMLFTRSLQNLQNIDPGFNTAHLLKFRVNPLQAGYSQDRIKSFGEDLRQQLKGLPGVQGVAIATVPLLQDTSEGGDITVKGMQFSSGSARNAFLGNAISPEYFSALRMPVVAGRQFNAGDSLPTSNLAIVNQTFVRQFLPGQNPIGAHFGYGSGKVPLDQTIIGVVGDSKHDSIRSKIIPFVYTPYLANDHLSELTFYVRASSDTRSISPGIRNVVHRVDANLPVNELSSMTDIINESLFVERSLGFLSIGFAILATLLAIVGLYGVMSYSVTRRSREFGIRMAIGATPERVLRLVLRESALLGIGGVVCAIPFVIATIIYIRSVLYGSQPNNSAVCFAAAALLVGIALLAGFVPAWTAAHIDPHTALRRE